VADRPYRLKEEPVRSYRFHVALAATLGAVALVAGAVRAATAAPAWSRISGPTQAGSQLGLARTADGVLHVIWNRGNSSTSISETRLSPAGKAIGTSTVATGWNGNGGLALVAMPDKSLRLFAPGTGGINTFTAPTTGGSWTHQSGVGWGGAIAESAYVIGATLTKDGQPVTAWRGNAGEGVPPASIPLSGYQGGMAESFLATDAASGAVVLAGATNSGQGGVYAQKILPSPGPKVVLPPLGKEWGNGLSGRIGAAGVYVAYADGKNVHLYRYGGGSKTIASGSYWSATVCAAPAARLWIAWGDTSGGLFATRSNHAASAFEPVQKLKLPGSELTFVQCEGSAGPVDLFASGQTNGGFFHTHLLAQFTLRAQASKGKVTVSVRDAGDPVAGVRITVAGKHLTTDAHGVALLTLRPGSYSATATAAGYAPASARLTVR
jgi:hypothetical protein